MVKKSIEKDELLAQLCNFGGMIASKLGLNPTVGKIYTLLYFSKTPVSLNEMVEKLGISKGGASVNIRYLESWGAVRGVWKEKSRRDHYEANQDIMNIFSSRLKNRFSEPYSKFKELKTKLLERNDAQSEVYKKKFEELDTIVQFIFGFFGNGENNK